MENAKSDGQQNHKWISHDLLHSLSTGWILALVFAGESPQVTIPLVQGSLSSGLTTDAAPIPIASVAVLRGVGSGMAGQAFTPYPSSSTRSNRFWRPSSGEATAPWCFGWHRWSGGMVVSGITCRINREPNVWCHQGFDCWEDTVRHTLAEYATWEETHPALISEAGSDMSLPAVIKSIRIDGIFCNKIQYTGCSKKLGHSLFCWQKIL